MDKKEFLERMISKHGELAKWLESMDLTSFDGEALTIQNTAIQNSIATIKACRDALRGMDQVGGTNGLAPGTLNPNGSIDF